MAIIVELKSEEATVNATASSVSSNQLLRVYAPSGGLITMRDSANNILGSTTLATGGELYLEKEPSDTIESDTNVQVTAVAFK